MTCFLFKFIKIGFPRHQQRSALREESRNRPTNVAGFLRRLFVYVPIIHDPQCGTETIIFSSDGIAPGHLVGPGREQTLDHAVLRSDNRSLEQAPYAAERNQASSDGSDNQAARSNPFVPSLWRSGAITITGGLDARSIICRMPSAESKGRSTGMIRISSAPSVWATEVAHYKAGFRSEVYRGGRPKELSG